MMKQIIAAIVRRMIWFGCWFLPVNNKKIVLSSYYGKGYGDNPKYIAEELIKSGLDYRLIWMIKDDRDKKFVPSGITPCKLDTIKGIFHITTAKIWIDNCRKPFFYKKKQQYYIQTWHGFALKRIERDVAANLSDQYVKTAKLDSKAIDLIISDSKFMTGIYKNAFWYNGKIVEWGSPRNDVLICNEGSERSHNEIHNYYNIPSSSKIVLYAPTFRTDGSMEPYKINLEKVRKACQKRFSADFVVLVRLHPNIAQRSFELDFKWNNKLIDASKYPDMQILLSAADVVISDYSSLMFDFALSEKPCFQFATDIEAYKKDRNFYFPLDKLPFSTSKTTDELVPKIIKFNETDYLRKITQFFDEVGMNRSGNSAQKCAKLIKEICFDNRID